MKKNLTHIVMALALLGLCGTAAISIKAEGINGNYPPIVQKLAERFNLNTDEVKEFFDEAREEKRQEMQTHFEERLNKLIANGKLSEEQKEAVLAKMNEMQGEYEGLKNLSPEEKRAKMGEIKEEIKTWTEENGIDLGILKGFNKGFGKGFGLRAFRKGW